jgi:predicted GIY-YIG superfamily endonuclease
MTHLYRHFDVENNLLYVGISLSTINRLGQHQHHSKWFDEIKVVTIEHFLTRQDAINAEKKAIQNENPKYNIALKKTAQEVATDEKLVIRHTNLTSRFVEYRVAYRLDELRDLMNMTSKELQKHVGCGNISVFYVEGRPSWKTQQIKMIPMVSGWAMIDFVHYLESKGEL